MKEKPQETGIHHWIRHEIEDFNNPYSFFGSKEEAGETYFEKNKLGKHSGYFKDCLETVKEGIYNDPVDALMVDLRDDIYNCGGCLIPRWFDIFNVYCGVEDEALQDEIVHGIAEIILELSA